MTRLLLFFVLLLASATNSVTATTDLTAFVYKTCSNNQTLQHQTFKNQTLQNQPTNLTLDGLFTALISQSSTTNFFQTTVNNITGLYQCRSDLSHPHCNTCVQKLTNTIQTSCYTARAQLVGCYLWYGVGVNNVDYPAVNGLWHEKCGVQAGTGTHVDMAKNDALRELVDRVGNKGHFARGSYYYYEDGPVYVSVLGQCESDLGSDDCADCVKTAVDFAQDDCRSSFTGDVYLHKCYISYSDGGDRYGRNAGGLVALMATILFVLL